MLMGIIIIRNNQLVTRQMTHLAYKLGLKLLIKHVMQPSSSRRNKRLHILMIMIIICIAQIASSLSGA